MSKHTDLIAAISANNFTETKTLVLTGADPNFRNGEPLATAINAGNYPIAQILLRNGASPKLTLPLAIGLNPESVRLLLKYCWDKPSYETLELALSSENAETIQLFTEYGAPVMQKGNQLLHQAAATGKTAIVQGILNGLQNLHTTRPVAQVSAITSALNSGGAYALRLAQQNGHRETEAVLQEFHNAYGFEGNGHPNAESSLFSWEITPTKPELRAALYQAAGSGEFNIVDGLLSETAKWGFIEQELQNALIIATGKSRSKVIRYLTEAHHVSMPSDLTDAAANR